MIAYLAIVALLVLTLAFWWRSLGRVGRCFLVTVILLGAVALCPFPILPGRTTPRSVVGYLLNLPSLVDTGRFAPEYTHARFNKVRIGMTQEQILDLVGEPLERYVLSTGHDVWVYADDQGDAPIFVAAYVYFDINGTEVVELKWGVGAD